METLIAYFIFSLIPSALVLLRFYLNSKQKRKKGDLRLRVVKFIVQSSTVLLSSPLFTGFANLGCNRRSLTLLGKYR